MRLRFAVYGAIAFMASESAVRAAPLSTQTMQASDLFESSWMLAQIEAHHSPPA